MIYEIKKNKPLEVSAKEILTEQGVKFNAVNIFGKKLVETKGKFSDFIEDWISSSKSIKFNPCDYDGDGLASSVIIEKRDYALGAEILNFDSELLQKTCNNEVEFDFFYNDFVRKNQRKLDNDANFSITILPHRIYDGYGFGKTMLSKVNIIVKCINRYFGYNAEVFIETADNGIRSNETIEEANALGYRVMVTDHHEAVGELPNAEVIINPHTCEQPFLRTQNICGACVCALLASSIANKFKRGNPMAKIFEYASVATVTDVMPLEYENLFLVDWFLKRANEGRLADIHIEKMLNATGASLTATTTDDIGFGIGPLINCCGRLASPYMALDYFQERVVEKQYERLAPMFDLNEKRKVLSHEFTNKALAQDTSTKVVVVSFDNCPEGIVGIIASHLVDRTGKPSFVFTKCEDGTYKGSGRSIDGWNMLENATCVFDSNPELVTKFGGHAGAMGLTLTSIDSVNKFRELISLRMTDDIHREEKNYILYDDDYSLKELYEAFYSYGPFGEGRPKPVFVAKKFMYGLEAIKSMHEQWISYFGGKRHNCFNFNCIPDASRDGQEHTFAFTINKTVKIVRNQMFVSYEPYIEEILD